MKFRVTAVLWEDCYDSINAACHRLEDWLTASLADGDFGEQLDQICFVVVATEEDPDQNQARASAFDKLVRYKDPYDGGQVRHLSFGISIPYNIAITLSPEQATKLVAEHIRQKVSTRPRRLPKGFDLNKLSGAVQASTSVFATAA